MLDRTAIELTKRLSDYELTAKTALPLRDFEEATPVEVRLQNPHGEDTLTALFLPVMTVAALDQANLHHQGRLLILGPRIHERSAETFRALGLNYLDQQGNAYLSLDSTLIDVRGRKVHLSSEEDSTYIRKAGSTPSLNSTKRSQVIFAVLSWPELLNEPLRTLARAAGVSVGQAQDTVKLLQESGHLQRVSRAGYRKISRSNELMERWAAAYPRRFNSPKRQRAFQGDLTEMQLPKNTNGYISGEQALPGEIRNPETLILYTENFPSELVTKNRWRRDGEPNVFIRQQFWAPLDEQVEHPSLKLAPPLLIYADLLASNDSRLIEAAKQYRTDNAQLRQF